MYKFEGFARISKVVETNFTKNKSEVNVYDADVHINLLDCEGTCTVHNLRHPGEEGSITSYRIIYAGFEDFLKMFSKTNWHQYRFIVRVNLGDKTLYDLSKIFCNCTILERKRLFTETEYGDYDEDYGYQLIKHEDIPEGYHTENCYLDISDSLSVCLFFGDYENPDYSIVIVDHKNYESIFEGLVNLIREEYNVHRD